MTRTANINSNCHFCERITSELSEAGHDIILSPNKKHRICQDCAAKITMITSSDTSQKTTPNILCPDLDSFTPQSIFNILDEYVMCQDHAKKTISLSMYQHLQRINGNYNVDQTKVSKSNILLTGPSGTGKTLIIDTLEKHIKLPFVSQNANSFSSTGYSGRDVSDILYDLYVEAGEDLEFAEQGIVFIDEIDKIRISGQGMDVNGAGVQQSLLKIMEGSSVHISNSENDIDLYIDTTNILFICAGAFSGIKDIVLKRLNTQTMGFASKLKDNDDSSFDYSLISHQDLVKYGFMEEFLGRLPVLTHLVELDEDQFSKMLTEPKNSLIKQYEAIFKNEGTKLSISQNGLSELVKQSIKCKLGARGARNIMSQALNDELFSLASGKDVSHLILDFNGSEFIITYEENELRLVSS